MDHIAWLLEEGGVVERKIVAAHKFIWPGQARVTFEDGTTEIVPILNILSRDDLDTRYVFPPAVKP